MSMIRYSFHIITDNEDGVMSSICNLFSSRGFSIDSIAAQPLNDEKTLSSIIFSIDLPPSKINNFGEKLLQIVPIRDVKIYKVERVF